MEYKEQLNEAEKALWQIFSVVERTRKNKTITEIRQIVADYLNAKINTKTKERGNEK
jgi:hypothetical protein